MSSSDAAVNATALANGLRRNLATEGRRWNAWPGGREQLARAVRSIDRATSVEDLRAVLEWITYQSASLTAARALVVARRTRTLSSRLGLLDESAPPLQRLADAEADLIELVRTRCGYMAAVAERCSHLELPPPLVTPESLV